MKILKRVFKITIFSAATLAFAKAQMLQRPQVPSAIKASPDEQVVFIAHAKGVQVYECAGDATMSLGWTFKEPQADLFDDSHKMIGKHYKGPTWKLNDGSEITGKTLESEDSPDKDSVPWLLLKVATNSGKGALSRVTTVQRVNTKGGHAPLDACDATKPDNVIKVPYTADYYFYAPKQ